MVLSGEPVPLNVIVPACESTAGMLKAGAIKFSTGAAAKKTAADEERIAPLVSLESTDNS